MRASALAHWRAGALAGVVAGVVATAAQLLLWLAFTDALPALLFRDARLAAAIVLGETTLARPDDDAAVLLMATIVHFALSIVYGIAIGAIVQRMRAAASIAAGAAAGAGLFFVNMYGFTAAWPWFEAARDPITFAAHVVFGTTAALASRRLARRSERTPLP
jgi:hypothetical protein